MSRTKPMLIGTIGDALVTVNDNIGDIVDEMERPSSSVSGRSDSIIEARDMATRLARDLLNLSIRLTSAARLATSNELVEKLESAAKRPKE
jgi:hypothetical protein